MAAKESSSSNTPTLTVVMSLMWCVLLVLFHVAVVAMLVVL